MVPVIANNGLVAKGETPSASPGTTTRLAGRRSASPATRRSTSSSPQTGRFAGVYVQAISAYAPHPNAAKLWMEYLYSDEGQLLWMKGYCHPIREADMRARGVDPGRLLAKLPGELADAVFPSLDQLNAAKTSSPRTGMRSWVPMSSVQA